VDLGEGPPPEVWEEGDEGSSGCRGEARPVYGEELLHDGAQSSIHRESRGLGWEPSDLPCTSMVTGS
jgi:hypothetical protein